MVGELKQELTFVGAWVARVKTYKNDDQQAGGTLEAAHAKGGQRQAQQAVLRRRHRLSGGRGYHRQHCIDPVLSLAVECEFKVVRPVLHRLEIDPCH